MPKIALILTEGFADWEYGYIAGTGGPFYRMDVKFFTPSPGEVTSQGGLRARVDASTDRITDWAPEVLVAVGGLGWDRKGAPDISKILVAQHESAGAVAGICAGTLALARAGFLNDVRHTSNDPAFLVENAPAYTGAERYEASACAIDDGRIVTAPGTAPASFAAAIFRHAGMDDETAARFLAMTAAEHG